MPDPGALTGQSYREELATMRNLAVDLAQALSQYIDYHHGIAPCPDTGAALSRARKAGLLRKRTPQRTGGGDG